MNRRKFIYNGAKGLFLANALARGLSPKDFLAYAESNPEPHFFLHMHAQGGLDSPLGLNPLPIAELLARGITEEEFFFLYKDEDVKRQSINGNTVKYGVTARPLIPFAKDICVINGVLMNYEVPAHPGNINYAISGSTTPDAQTFAVQLAQALGDSPRGVGYSKYTYPLQPGTFTGGLIKFNAGPKKDGFNGAEAGADMSGGFDDGGNKKKNLAKLTDFLKVKAKTSRQSGLALSSSQLDIVTAANFTPVEDLIAKLKSENPLVMNQGIECAAYFLSGSMKYAHIDVSDEFGREYPGYVDTHHDHPTRHIDLATKIFKIIADIMDMFKKVEYGNTGKSLFDLTTFVYTTEFGRTPYKQGSTGADHNPRVASHFVAGKGIQGGQVIGESHLYSKSETEENRSRLQALPFSFSDGRALTAQEVGFGIPGRPPIQFGMCENEGACYDYIYPETILKTVAQAFGINAGTPLITTARTLPMILKKG